MESEYNPLDAARVAHAALPEAVRSTLPEAAVLEILELEFEFYQSQLEADPAADIATNPGRYGAAPLVTFVVASATRSGNRYTAEQVAHVLAAEQVYLHQIGLLAADTRAD